MVGPEQRIEPESLGGLGERKPRVPAHAFLPFDHETEAHAA
jgi:hypothetical protein